MKCEVCKLKKVHVEDLREDEDGPVVATINRCSNCGHIQKSKNLKKGDNYKKYAKIFFRKNR
jgi:transcriptional regulator NrdR family protein